LSNQILLTFTLFQYVKELYELAVLGLRPEINSNVET